MGKRYLTRREWKKYLQIVQKELRGEKITKAEEKIQQKGDATVKKGYHYSYI